MCARKQDRKNALEEYVYDVRDKLESAWKKFASPEEAEKLRALASQAEDWLYSDEGEDATKSAYVERLDGLKTLGGPVALRYKEQDDRPRAASQLRELLHGYQEKANSPDYQHIPADKLQNVIEDVANTESWLSNKLASQSEKMPYEKLSITSAEMLKKKDE